MDFLTKAFGAVAFALALACLLWLYDKGKETRWFAALTSRTSPGRIKFISNWGPLVGIVLMLGAMAAYFYAQRQSEREGLEHARGEFVSKTLTQAIAYCLSLPNFPRYDAPLAIAWNAKSLDWYVLEGADNASMRHYSCDGTGGLSQGERYERVLLKRVPLEGRRPGRVIPKEILFDRYAQDTNLGLVALEAALDPVTGALVERRWLASGEIRLSDEGARDLPALLSQAPSGLANAPSAQRIIRTPTDWTQTPHAVFAQLEKHVLPHQRVAMLHFRQKEIKVTVVGPIEVDSQPTAAFGQLSFDAYGVADQQVWTPTRVVDGACAQGSSLSEIKAGFFAEQPSAKLLLASFDCSSASAPDSKGHWRLRNYDQR